MNNETVSRSCPKCGAQLEGDAAQGLCARCLLAAVSAADEVPTVSSTPTEGPDLEAVARAFPQLELHGLIGHGGMGYVFKARQSRLDRVVALKILAEGLARDPAFAERFGREARVLARLNHPNIVTVYDFGQAGPYFYLLMEYVEGANLRQAMRAGRLTPAQALDIVPRICEALQYAHGEGVLHRDIKPENILMDTRGRVKIADFGIAKLMGESRPDASLTASGAVLGTPHYMAPEQIEKPAEVDHRADIYSLGVVFYEMLTGELPIGRFAAPSEKSPVDARVDDVVLRALEKEKERRYQNAGEVKTRLDQIAGTPVGAAAGGARPVSADAPEPGGSSRPGTGAGVQAAAPVDAPVRTSKLAVASAVLSIPSWLQVLALVWLHAAMVIGRLSGTDGMAGVGVGVGEFLVMGSSGILGLIGLILGIVALGDIRRSGGRLHGLGLAIMGVMGVPLSMAMLVAPTALLILSRSFEWRFPGVLGVVFMWLLPVFLFAPAVLAIRGLYRWARHPASGGSSAHGVAWVAGAIGIGLCLLLGMGMALAGCLTLRPDPRTPPVGIQHQSGSAMPDTPAPGPAEEER